MIQINFSENDIIVLTIKRHYSYIAQIKNIHQSQQVTPL